MAILSRVKISPQQRYDLEDLFASQAAARTDAKLWTQKFLSESNLILNGFTVSGLGLSSATVNMANASFIIPQNTDDFSYFISAPSEPNVTIPDADLADGVRNYLEVELVTEDGTPLTKAFWDPEANSGNGAEFNQIVDTVTDLKCNFVVLQGGFSGLPDRLPIAILDVDGSGAIKCIFDRRELFGRLAKPNDLDNEYSWGSKVEPTFALNMTSVTGTFIAGEELTIGSETATVTTGGTSTIAFNEPSGISFSNGDSVTGVTSGATGTVNTISESFTGVDKSLNGQKEINDALMTEIKKMKGTRFWWQDSESTLVRLESFFNSLIAPITSGAKVSWSGSVLSITDSDGTPSSTDAIAKIRLFGDVGQLSFFRQDGQAGTSTLAIADGQVLYVELPSAGLDRSYTGGIGAGSTNYKVVARNSFVPNDTNYWIAYREGSKLFFRGNGELQANESAEIGDNVPQTLLNNIGLTDESSAPVYSSDIRGTASESIVSRTGTLTDAMGDSQEDRSAFIRSDDEVLWDGSQLSFTSDIVLEVLNTKSGTTTLHTILAAGSPVSVNDGESLYISINRASASENVSLVRSSVTPIPAQTQANKDVFVLFKRVDASGVKYLHLPFHKQLVLEGASFRLGQAGSGSGVTKVTLHDAIVTTLPTGASVTVDGISGANGDLVLFTNLSSGNNQVYKLSGVGTSIAWTAVRPFNGSLTPSDADLIVVAQGESFGNQVGQFVDTEFKFNETIRLFRGIDYVELSAPVTSTLADNTVGTVFSVPYAGSENILVSFSMLRNGIKEMGSILVTTDGITAAAVTTSASLGATGISFTADISGSDVRLRYTSTNTGFTTSMKYFTQRWSDTPGGVGGLATYTPFVATVANSAFLMSDNSGTPVNASPAALVLGLTQVTLGFSYLTGANPGTTVGDLEVFVNGQRFPRYIAGATVDGYYKEISSTIIEFHADLSVAPMSIEVIKRV